MNRLNSVSPCTFTFQNTFNPTNKTSKETLGISSLQQLRVLKKSSPRYMVKTKFALCRSNVRPSGNSKFLTRERKTKSIHAMDEIKKN